MNKENKKKGTVITAFFRIPAVKRSY